MYAIKRKPIPPKEKDVELNRRDIRLRLKEGEEVGTNLRIRIEGGVKTVDIRILVQYLSKRSIIIILNGEVVIEVRTKADIKDLLRRKGERGRYRLRGVKELRREFIRRISKLYSCSHDTF